MPFANLSVFAKVKLFHNFVHDIKAS